MAIDLKQMTLKKKMTKKMKIEESRPLQRGVSLDPLVGMRKRDVVQGQGREIRGGVDQGLMTEDETGAMGTEIEGSPTETGGSRNGIGGITETEGNLIGTGGSLNEIEEGTETGGMTGIEESLKETGETIGTEEMIEGRGQGNLKTVKPVLSGHLKKDKTKVLMEMVV